MATPGYFQTMGIPVMAGRGFTDDDREGGAPVVIISRGLARQSFPDRDPVGRYLLIRDTPAGFRPLQIVGVAGDVRHTSLEAQAEPHVYLPYHQTHRDLLVWLTNNQFLLVRTAGPALALTEAVRRELQAVDSTVAAADIRTSGYYLDNATAARRFSLELLAGFAVLALALAAIGIYGVVSYTVAQRTREIGLRMALGAAPSRVRTMVLRQVGVMTAVGGAIGLAAAIGLGHLAQSLLFQMQGYDATVLVTAAIALTLVALAAGFVPAHRASQVDPMTALRYE
jgi:predicted permease